MKRPSIIKAISICALIIVLASNCKKPSVAPKPHITLGPFHLGEAKEYLYFKPGSYWVYKNNVTSQIDTITMISIDTSRSYVAGEFPKAFYDYYYTHIEFVQHSSLLKTNLLNKMYEPGIDSYGVSINRWYFDAGYPSEYVYFRYPYNYYVDTTSTYSSTPIYFPKQYNLKSGTFQFDSAVQLRIYDESLTPKSSITKMSIYSDHYFVKNVGLVKIYTRSYYPETKETWELIDYKIK